MPTIEIISVNAVTLDLNQKDFTVAILEENELISHRGLFDDMLQLQKGVIVHIGNPSIVNDHEEPFFAGALVDWSFEPGNIIIGEDEKDEPEYNTSVNQQFCFKFLDQYKQDIDMLLNYALIHSPNKKVLFLTDYQFGPENARVEIIYTINNFWELHNRAGLGLNTMYEIYGR
jgi:hypothetical protein